MPHLDCILCAGHQHEQQQDHTDTAGQQLVATLKLVLQLIRFKFGLSKADSDLLATYLLPQVKFVIRHAHRLDCCATSGKSRQHTCQSIAAISLFLLHHKQTNVETVSTVASAGASSCSKPRLGGIDRSQHVALVLRTWAEQPRQCFWRGATCHPSQCAPAQTKHRSDAKLLEQRRISSFCFFKSYLAEFAQHCRCDRSQVSHLRSALRDECRPIPLLLQRCRG